MAEPGSLMGQSTSNVELDETDIDGEYEVDDGEYDEVTVGNSQNGNTTDAEGSDIDAEGSDEDAEGSDVDAEGSDVDAEGEEVDDDDDGEPVGAVKVAAHRRISSDEEDEDDDNDDDGAVDLSSDAKTSDGEDSSESEAQNSWQGESEEEEEPDTQKESSNDCIYCHQGEEDDPSEEFEEYLACATCGENAHRQCARDANTLSSDDNAKNWRCEVCLQNDLHNQQETSESLTRRRLSSVPKLARDLLPSHRGAHPGGHSMFNDLILPEDPMDGSRSLRKRKPSHEDDAPPVFRPTRKKRRSSEASKSEADGSVAASSPRAHSRITAVSGNETEAEDGAHPSASEHGSTRLRSSRRDVRQPQPARRDKRPLVWIEDNAPPTFSPLSLVVVFHLNNEKVQKIVTTKPKKKILDPRLEARRERDRERRDRNRRAAQQNRAESPDVSHYPPVQQYYGTPFYGLAEKETDETKNKPYGGILSEADADTSKTYPTHADRKRFEEARQKAEDDWKAKQAVLQAQDPIKPSKQAGPPSKIKCINFGGWEIDTWHAAPYPEEYSKNRVLYICEFCLKYMNSDYVAWRHKLKCPAKHPPGDEIYRDGKYSFFEVDGRKNPVYCQNLCLLAKLFLGSKTLYYDVEPFLFYVMTENDNYGCHFVGYFSKEKRPSSLNNVSCILVLPIHMRKGYGQFLIEFSYLLTRVEKKTGSPEKPLSDMGLVSYRKYWRLVLCEELLRQKSAISITTISERTGMTPDDIVSALEGLRALVRDPVTKNYALRLDYKYFEQYIEKCNANNNPKIHPESLVWTPYVMGRLGQYEDGPALHTVQPREELDEDAPAPEEGVQMETAAKNGVAKEDGAIVEDEAESETPALPVEESINGDSPAPGTPLANGSTVALAGSQPSSALPSVPPYRFEVYPPIPGQPAAKRRPGRPFGSRRRTSTPQRTRSLNMLGTAPSRLQLSPSRNGSGKATPNGATTPSLFTRRTRSRLGETVVNGIDDDEAAEGGAVKGINGRTRSGTRSSTGSPRTAKNLKGKSRISRVVHDEEDYENEDAEGDDIDADGEMDLDAEGEDDDELMMDV